MLTGKYTTIARVLENVIRDTGFTDEVTYADAIEWAYRAMQFIGAPQIYITKVTDGNKDLEHPDPILVANYRAELPSDLHSIIQIRDYHNRASLKSSTYNFSLSSNMREATVGNSLEYIINDGYIFTNFKDGYLEIAYEAFPTDKEGYPMIPEDERYLKAVESYIIERIARKLWLQDKINDYKYKALEQDWLFYVNSAKTKAQMPSLDEMESLKNQLLRLISHPDRHKHQFTQLGDAEQLRVRMDRLGKVL
jgi:hypothetical protein